MRILVVEDDPLLGRGVQAGLEQAGFGADWVRDGVAAATALGAGEYAAVVLDLGLPRLEGLELLRRLRGRGDRTPVLILTARDALEDRVKGLDAGADDYVVKPFQLDELAARLRALVRRAHGEAAPVLSAAGVTLDPGARTVDWQGSRSTCRRASSTCCTSSCSTPGACCRASTCRAASTAGARKSRATRSRCTSTTCAASSRRS